jgi:hypothetical protein
MWKVNGKQIRGRWLDLARPRTVLYDFDGPKIFTCNDSAGSLFVAYQCGEEDKTMRFLVVPFSDDMARRLTAGEIGLYEVLTQPHAWIFDVNYEWETTGLWEVAVQDLPPKTIPKPGVMLWPHLQPRMPTTVPPDIPQERKPTSLPGEPLNKPG